MARPALFLERARYRRRRLGEAARLLPVLGTVLFVFPALWAVPETAAGMLYLFSAWWLLIVATFLISRRLSRSGPGGPGEEDG